jgi:hypothetical protein
VRARDISHDEEARVAKGSSEEKTRQSFRGARKLEMVTYCLTEAEANVSPDALHLIQARSVACFYVHEDAPFLNFPRPKKRLL